MPRRATKLVEETSKQDLWGVAEWTGGVSLEETEERSAQFLQSCSVEGISVFFPGDKWQDVKKHTDIAPGKG